MNCIPSKWLVLNFQFCPLVAGFECPLTAALSTVSQSLFPLQPGATYYYRLVASNAYATVQGAVQSFVAATNTAPILSDLVDLTLRTNTSSGPIPFTVGDAETAANDLVVTAGAFDSTLVPPANLLVAGTGSARSLTVTPAPALSGVTGIYVAVSDGLATTTKGFVLTVATNVVVGVPAVVGLNRQSGGLHLQLQGTGGIPYTLQVSSNLSQWSLLTHLVAAPNGLFQYLDPTTNAPSRFYRLSFP